MKIKSEGNPKRCEICHKSDYFDPIENHCSLCNSLNQNLEKPSKQQIEHLTSRKQNSSFTQRMLSFIVALPLIIVAKYLFIKLINADFREFESTPIEVFSRLAWPTLTVFYLCVRLLTFSMVSNLYQLKKITRIASIFFLLPLGFVTLNLTFFLLRFAIMSPFIILVGFVLFLPLLLVCIGVFYHQNFNAQT